MNRVFPTGTTVAMRYTIIEPLGSGGMATVYRARHLTLRREVALKVLAPQVTGPLAARFDREARNAARLDHPGCVRVFDYGTAVDGSRFLAMDLLTGPTLREEIDRGDAFPVGRALWIAGELLKALGHAHERGVLHRDVKPENVMFSDRNDVVLIDFGLSQLDDDAPLTALGTCIGSPSYLSPERLLGRPYDERADLYAVGIILYELLAGRRPFLGAGPLEVAVHQIDSEPPPLSRLRPDIPRSLAALVHRALAKEPADRFASAGEMLAALELAHRRATALAAAVSPPSVHHSETAALARVASPAVFAPVAPEREQTTCVVGLVVRRSWWRRLWGWLRFGRWRWRPNTATPTPTLTEMATATGSGRWGW